MPGMAHLKMRDFSFGEIDAREIRFPTSGFNTY